MESIITTDFTETKYPCLKQNKATKAVILFVSESSGTVVYSGGSLSLGMAFTKFDPLYFEEFTGEVFLKN